MTDEAIEAALREIARIDGEVRIGKHKGPMDVMRMAIAAYEQAMWRSIDDGAKTGSQFIILEQGKHMFLAKWWNCYSPFYRSEVYGFWTSTDPSQAHVILPEDATHYRSLPLPPSLNKK